MWSLKLYHLRVPGSCNQPNTSLKCREEITFLLQLRCFSLSQPVLLLFGQFQKQKCWGLEVFDMTGSALLFCYGVNQWIGGYFFETAINRASSGSSSGYFVCIGVGLRWAYLLVCRALDGVFVVGIVNSTRESSFWFPNFDFWWPRSWVP